MRPPSCGLLIFDYGFLMLHWSCRDWPEREEGQFVRWCYRNTKAGVLHDHDFMELFWVEAGEGVHHINGESRPLRRGDLVLIRPEDRHAFASAQKAQFLEFSNVAFRTKLWSQLKRRFLPEQEILLSSATLGSRQFHLTVEEMKRMEWMAGDLRHGAVDLLAVSAFLAGVVSLLMHRNPQSGQGKAVAPDWLEYAARQIQQYPNFCGGVPVLVRLAGRCGEHVARECRKYFLRRPVDLVNEARLKYLMQQLEQTDRTILDLAAEVGFENVGHFYGVFKQHSGVSPAVYRKRHREKL